MKTRCDKRDDFNIPNVVHWMLTGYTTRAGARKEIEQQKLI
jgi:hypothetical protein